MMLCQRLKTFGQLRLVFREMLPETFQYDSEEFDKAPSKVTHSTFKCECKGS
jgi:hypothetical protein